MPPKSNIKSQEKRNGVSSRKSKSTVFSESPWSVLSFLRSLDIFGQPIPTFNIKGKDKVQTVVGGFFSAAVITMTLGFAIGGMHNLVSRSDPTIN